MEIPKAIELLNQVYFSLQEGKKYAHADAIKEGVEALKEKLEREKAGEK